jgi:branched-chain amino acid transport system permease protein
MLPGEIVGLIGPNGSGKTTLLNLVGGQEQADGGHIIFTGRGLDRLPPHGRARLGIARSFQTPSLAPSLSALDNVALASRNPGAGLARARAEAAFQLAACGLLEVAALPTSRLGPAQMRRVEIARALILEPRLLLLDEPAAGLSSEDRQELAALLRGLATNGTALLVVEHDMGFILPLADRIPCLDAGRLIALGTPAEIAADPAVIAVYLGREA